MNTSKTTLPEPVPTTRLKGWGGMSVPGREVRGQDLDAITAGATLSRGLGRSYGDAALPPPGVYDVVGTTLADRYLSFDEKTGLLTAQAGVSLEALNRTFLRQGWFSPVSPGTWYVTLGGMVASDVHGKNHHVAGTFGRHVQSLRMRVANGDIVRCSRTEHPDLFFATLGGMGLTGHILDVTFTMQRIPSPWIWREAIRIPNFDALLDGLESSADWPQTVCWIDSLATGKNFGRGLLMRGRWAERSEAPPIHPSGGFRPTVPFDLPEFLLNDFTVKAFNQLYYMQHIWRYVRGTVTPRGWFAPLDAIQHWYRAYGPRGFTQHQAVIPREAGRERVRDFCEILARRGGTGFLVVIKDCGEEGEGLLSFPRPGMSVALDLPVRDDTQDLIDELNQFVLDVGGRIYLTKDGYTRPDHFRAMEGDRLDRFLDVRHKWDPNLSLRSAQSVRLFGDPA